jgi:hypothetical protein
MITAAMNNEQGAYRDRSYQQNGLPPMSFGRTYLPTPPLDDHRARPSLPASTLEQRMSGYRLPQPMPNSSSDRRVSAAQSYMQDPYGAMQMNHHDAYSDLRRGSMGQQQQQHQHQHQQMVMVPTYMPMYGSHDQWSNAMPQHGGQWPPQSMHMPMPGYGLVQRPLPPAPMGPVEKPKKRRSPPSPQYLHMTVAEMIEELAYRKVDTTQLQARKAKKAEYIDQLQKADRNGNRGRGAWKACHGDVPPLDEVKD